jgi:hypothetical protein
MNKGVTFHNKAAIKIQAQIFAERALVSTGVVDPGQSCVLSAESGPYDIYFKNGATGWEVAHLLDSEAKTLTLSRPHGRYIVT